MELSTSIVYRVMDSMYGLMGQDEIRCIAGHEEFSAVCVS